MSNFLARDIALERDTHHCPEQLLGENLHGLITIQVKLNNSDSSIDLTNRWTDIYCVIWPIHYKFPSRLKSSRYYLDFWKRIHVNDYLYFLVQESFLAKKAHVQLVTTFDGNKSSQRSFYRHGNVLQQCEYYVSETHSLTDAGEVIISPIHSFMQLPRAQPGSLSSLNPNNE